MNAAAIATPRVKRKLPPRSEQVKTLQSGEEYDVIIIGGGATGAGCALDAITRGKHKAWCLFFGPIDLTQFSIIFCHANIPT